MKQSRLLISMIFLQIAGMSYAASVAEYDSIQAAIDANPGRMVFVPEGEYRIKESLTIRKDNTGLYGYGTIIQDDPEKTVLYAEHARGIRIKDLTFTRAQGKQDSTECGIRFDDCPNLLLDGLRVSNCKSRQPAMNLNDCKDGTIRNCEIRNYKRIAIDDRTDSDEYGYAFICIDGTGLIASRCVGLKVQDNRILDYDLLPTPEAKEKHNLGTLTEGKRPTKFGPLGKHAKKGYVSNWHQGSALLLSHCDNVSVTGNYLENCAQGIDVHSDNTVIANNTVYCGMMGVKLTHGTRNIIVDGNLLRRIDLWAILLNPGTGSHYAKNASGTQLALEANVDGGTIISNNLITEYGFGNEAWNWGASPAIALFEGQLDDEPPLRHVIIDGNMVYDVGRDKILKEGKAVQEHPRYTYAVWIGPWDAGKQDSPSLPRDITFGNNVFHPGTKGICNIPLESVAPKQ